ncbi:MAG: ankyrin repeat domain-containing protein [Planctomycetaceae bacterium]|nr:ankyrin repeat domain-containing protein [Planctomycetaceae bacterium]
MYIVSIFPFSLSAVAHQKKTVVRSFQKEAEVETFYVNIFDDSIFTDIKQLFNTMGSICMSKPLLQQLVLVVLFSCVYAPFLRPEETEGTPDLRRSIEEGNHNAVLRLINAKVDVNDRNIRGESPLYFAVQKGDEKIVKSLLEAGADIDARVLIGATDYRGTPLHEAVRKNHVEIIKILLQAGTDINIRSGLVRDKTIALPKDTPLPLNGATLRRFLKEAFDDLQGYTPLHSAIRSGQLEAMKYLIQAGANVNIEDTKSGETPLHIAAKLGLLEAAKCLIQAGADVDKRETELGDTPLIWAVQEGHLNMVKLLLDNSADVDIARGGKGGFTPLQYAVYLGLLEVVSILVEHKANPNYTDMLGGTPLSYVGGENCENAGQIYSLLVKSGATTGKPLLDAVLLGNAAKINALLESGTNINATDKFTGNTALHFAVIARNTEIVKILIHKGINANAKNKYHGPHFVMRLINGLTPLHIAVMNRDIDIVKLLIANKADVNATNADKNTALDIAIREMCDDIAELLIMAMGTCVPVQEFGVPPTTEKTD